MTPSVPSEPRIISRSAGPAALCGVSRVLSSPAGAMSLADVTSESKRPYPVEAWPAERVAAIREGMRHADAAGIALIRQVAGRTQTQVAEALGTQQSAVSRLERGGDLVPATINEVVPFGAGTRFGWRLAT